jgi:membrane associated rhomboid family serine protease
MVFLFRVLVPVPAIVAIGMWAVFQVATGIGTIAIGEETGGGVAYLAHIGGFVSGLVAGVVFRFSYGEPRHPRGTPASLYR